MITGRADRLRHALPTVLACVLSLIFFLQGYMGSRHKSLTFDEPIFISAGYTYVTRNDFRLNLEAPPLMQELAALPLLGMDIAVPGENHRVWEKADLVGFARLFADMNADRLAEIALRARLPTLLLGAGLVLAVFFWGRALYGPMPALAAAALAAVSPNLLAHAKLATTDLGCAAFMFLGVWTFWRASRTTSFGAWALCGTVTGLALIAKFTSLLLGPIYVVLMITMHLAGRPITRGFLIGAGLAAVVTFLVVGAGYNFSFDYTLYYEGLSRVYTLVTEGYQFYLFGEVSDEPWWYYHLAALAVKLPLATWVLIGTACVQLARDPVHREAAVTLLVPAAFVIGVSCFDAANIGLRRVLPALPFLILFTAQALAGPAGRIRRGLVVVLLLWAALDAVRIYPHHLAYFNAAAGGPERAPYLLDDSNIDWGQDLPALAAWQRAHPEARPLKLLYFGTVPPGAYGVDAVSVGTRDLVHPSPGVYAISAHGLVWLRKSGHRNGIDVDWLTRYQPVDRAGYSIWIYRFPE